MTLSSLINVKILSLLQKWAKKKNEIVPSLVLLEQKLGQNLKLVASSFHALEMSSLKKYFS